MRAGGIAVIVKKVKVCAEPDKHLRRVKKSLRAIKDHKKEYLTESLQK